MDLSLCKNTETSLGTSSAELFLIRWYTIVTTIITDVVLVVFCVLV